MLIWVTLYSTYSTYEKIMEFLLTRESYSESPKCKDFCEFAKVLFVCEKKKARDGMKKRSSKAFQYYAFK